MSRIEIESSLVQAVRLLTEAQQLKLLEFIKAMDWRKHQEPKNALAMFSPGFFPKEDLAEMSEAIKDCEKITPDEW